MTTFVRLALAAALMAGLTPGLGVASAGPAPPGAVPDTSVRGRVVDPQDRPVAGARVTVSCGSIARGAVTDEAGAFAIRIAGAAGSHPNAQACALGAPGCRIQIRHPGFTIIESSISPDGEHRFVLVVAPWQESLVVMGAGRSSLEVWTDAASFTRDDLRRVSTDVTELLAFARAAAGAAGRADRVYVDGVPRVTLPRARQIAALAVNVDPFSAAFSDPDMNRIEIETARPEQRWHASGNLAPVQLGGRSLLGGGHGRHGPSVAGQTSGPLPGLPLAFAAGAELALTTERVPVVAIPHADDSATSEASAASYFVTMAQASPRGRVSVDFQESRDRSTGAGAGGLVLPEAASNTVAVARELSVSVRRRYRRYELTSGFARFSTKRSSTAVSAAPAFERPGAVVSGGAAVADATAERSEWSWRTTLDAQASGGRWRMGFSVGSSRAGDEWRPNPFGTTYQGDSGEKFRIMDVGGGGSHAATAAAAAFAESRVITRAYVTAHAGVRLDLQRREGPLVSPRAWVARTQGRWTLAGGVGLFVASWSADALAGAQQLASGAARPLLVPLDGSTPLAGAALLHPRRSQSLMSRLVVGRKLGRVEAAVEHSWTPMTRVPSVSRAVDAAGWLDRFESRGRLRRHHVHARGGLQAGPSSFVLHYSWRRSHDDTSGWLGAAAPATDRVLEWAPTIGVPAHSVDVVGTRRFGRRASVTALASLRGASPVDFVLAPAGPLDVLLTRRPGARNAGRLPPSRTLTIYAHRRLDLSRWLAGPKRPVDLGVQVSNALDRENWTAIGTVAGSPTFGRPLAGAPGRSIRIWIALD